MSIDKSSSGLPNDEDEDRLVAGETFGPCAGELGLLVRFIRTW